MRLVFATNNQNKLKELQAMLGDKFELLSLKDINCDVDIPETGDTLEENARQKSMYIWENYKLNCFGDDTGLEVLALNNEPGVYSARYAGEEKAAEANMVKVLKNLEGKADRSAKFRTVISLIIDGEEVQFEGAVEGNILEVRQGAEGFGYDPIFLPHGFKQSFAEMDMTQKNEISHRGRAVRKLVAHLKNIKES